MTVVGVRNNAGIPEEVILKIKEAFKELNDDETYLVTIEWVIK